MDNVVWIYFVISVILLGIFGFCLSKAVTTTRWFNRHKDYIEVDNNAKTGKKWWLRNRQYWYWGFATVSLLAAIIFLLNSF